MVMSSGCSGGPRWITTPGTEVSTRGSFADPGTRTSIRSWCSWPDGRRLVTLTVGRRRRSSPLPTLPRLVAAVRLGRDDVEGRVAVEEADRLEREPGLGHRHDRPVLGSDEMGDADRVPEDDVLAVEGAVPAVGGQAAGIRVLVRVRARG